MRSQVTLNPCSSPSQLSLHTSSKWSLVEQSCRRPAARPVFHLFLPPCFHLLRFHAISSLPWFPWLSCVSVVTHRKFSRVQISKAKLEDSGNYTCVVENSRGKDNSTGTVNVQSSEYRLLSNKWSVTDGPALLLLRLFSCQLRDLKEPSKTGMQQTDTHEEQLSTCGPGPLIKGLLHFTR